MYRTSGLANRTERLQITGFSRTIFKLSIGGLQSFYRSVGFDLDYSLGDGFDRSFKTISIRTTVGCAWTGQQGRQRQSEVQESHAPIY